METICKFSDKKLDKNNRKKRENTKIVRDQCHGRQAKLLLLIFRRNELIMLNSCIYPQPSQHRKWVFCLINKIVRTNVDLGTTHIPSQEVIRIWLAVRLADTESKFKISLCLINSYISVSLICILDDIYDRSSQIIHLVNDISPEFG